MRKIEILEQLGGKRWDKGDKDRVYFNYDALVSLLEIETTYYNTGNLSSIVVDGQSISNSQGNKLLISLRANKFYYDVKADKFCYEMYYGKEIEQKLRAAISE